MNVFEAVKQFVTPRQAAEHYGVKVNRSGMACCPFHSDKNPSMKFYKQRFHCFGCQADGDVIDFAARLFGLSVKEAAEKLATDFGINYESSHKSGSRASPRPVKRKISEELRFKQAEQKCIRVYSDYLRLLERWRTEYAPKPDEKNWHPLFVEDLKKQTYVEYLLDVLLSGSLKERAELIAAQGEEVIRIERRISEFAARDPAGRGECRPAARTGTDDR
ncbi:MAG: CHC2 zinc finger domain-containing protein [Clostridiales bacterium]|nr:CHC2 zinc finger domain-containing protein [Clostridiales bacterium]